MRRGRSRAPCSVEFELAEGGTIFLDEVGELLPDTQVALLRVLQEREFERIGGGKSIRVDVRVITATNRDLKAAVANGTFREDLYYRLNVFPLEMPPLRARRADIPLLVEYFIDRYGRKAGKNIRSVDKKTLELLQSYPWPGNIRALQNVIERSIILCETEIFTVENRQPAVPSATAKNARKAKAASHPTPDCLRERRVVWHRSTRCRSRRTSRRRSPDIAPACRHRKLAGRFRNRRRPSCYPQPRPQ
jgi:transcriptional regulator with GAF, ATPase, and Fis domain